MDITIQVRGISDDIVHAIDLAAKAAGKKTRESYLRDLLAREFGPGKRASITSDSRMRRLLEEALKLGQYIEPAPSLPALARVLGYPDSAHLDAAYQGDAPFAFTDVDRLCEIFGFDRSWIETGRWTPYLQRARYHDSANVLAEFYRDGIPYRELYFVLSDEPRGEAAVYGRSDDYRYDLLVRDVPIHDQVGGGGERELESFAMLLAACDGSVIRWPFTSRKPSRSGRVLGPVDFRQLVEGEVHPAVHLSHRRGTGSNWHEDLWDLEYDNSVSYSTSYRAARELYVRNLALDGITTRADVERKLRSRFAMWDLTTEATRATS